MKKLFSHLLLSFLLIIFISHLSAAKIHAEDLNPVPTPVDPKSIPKDTRSWTKFKYKEIIEKTSQKYNLDPQLIYATIMTESEGNEKAYRYEPRLKEASLGLGQLLVSTAKRIGLQGDPNQMYEPAISIDLIGKYYRQFLDNDKNLSPQELTQAYNTGSLKKHSHQKHLSRFNKWYYEEG